MTIGNSLDRATDLLGVTLGTLSSSVDSPEAARALVESVGFSGLPSVPTALLDLQLALDGLLQAQTALSDARMALEEGVGGEPEVTAALLAVVAQVGLVISDVQRLPDAFRSDLAGTHQAYLDATHIDSEIEARLFGKLFVDGIGALYPVARHVLWVIGVLEVEHQEEDPATFRTEVDVHRIFISRLGDFFTDPAGLMSTVYGWNTPNLNTNRIFEVLQSFSFRTFASAEYRYPSETFLNAIAPGAAIPDDLEPMLVVPLPLGRGALLEFGFLGAPKQTPTEAQGLGLYLLGTGTLNPSFPLAPGVFLDLDLRVDATSGVGAVLKPGVGPVIVTNPDAAPVALTAGRVVARVSRRPEEDEPSVALLAIPGGAVLDAREVFVELGVEAASGPPDLFVQFGLTGGRLVVPKEGSDSFIGSFLPAGGLTLEFDLGLGWSKQRGLFFTGSASIEVVIPVHMTLGPFRVDLVRLLIALQGGGLTLKAGVVGGGTFGPVTVTVDALGAQLELLFRSGNLGPLQLQGGFSAPSGYGIAIDAGGVRGGGFLFIQGDTYAGALELSVFGVSVKAFGLIQTVLPDGTEGFSFVIVIIAEFTPIQLGFGFTLNGVGGLLGINRTFDQQALSEAVRTGSLAHLLFPVNVVENAPAIINDLATVFPAARNHQVFGPMAKLGWGTPTLITADIGIILEFPGPRLALLGVVSMRLPSAEFAILALNLAIAGVLDFPAAKISIDASLFDSYVASFSVSGDMAYRMEFGSRPSFLLSVGGFNPGFRAPAQFPTLRRCSADFGLNGNPSLTASGYFALTSNTAQFGAALELRASGYGIRLRGGFALDVMFVFSPFSFTASISAGVRVSFHGFGIGVTLHGSLSGPTPWHFKGRVCVEVCIWDACLPIDIKFGRAEPASLPEMDPWEGTDRILGLDPRIAVRGLNLAIQDPRNWAGETPAEGYSVVSLSAAASANRTPIDPVGSATLRQRVCPLNQELERFGEYRPIVHTRFDLSSVVMAGTSVEEYQLVEDDFASGQFTSLSNAEKLSANSYDKMIGGVKLAPDRVATGPSTSQTITYETVFVTAEGDRVEEAPSDVRYAPTQAELRGMLKRSSTARGGVRRVGAQKYMLAGRPKLLTLDAPSFVVVDACSMVQNTSLTPTEVTYTQALLSLRRHEQQNPSERKRFRVAPFHAAA